MLAKLGFGFAVTIICMSIVFLVLIALQYLIRIQRSLVEKMEDTTKEKPALKPQQPQAEPVKAAVAEEDNEELVAVISAAVAAVLGKPTSSIIVRSIRKIEPAAPSWAIAGRQDQIGSRF
jgi:sodium pump decarboxylase gamma subunit